MNLNIKDNINELSPMNNCFINKFNNAVFTKKLKIEEKSSLYSSTIFTSNSKTMTTQKNNIIKETSSLNLLSNVTFNDKISTVLKSVTNQDDEFEQNTILQIDKNNHKK